MTTPRQILDGTDWAALEHAYGPAGDLPPRLAGLLGRDPDAGAAAVADLEMGVLHQGTIYSSTAPAAGFVAAVLDADPTHPVRADLLQWLGDVADSAAWPETEPDAEPDEDERACQAIRPRLYRSVAPFLADADPRVRTEARRAAGHLLRAPDLAAARAETAARLLSAAAASDPWERAHVARLLDAWGIAPSALLHDPDPAVRAHAAVAVTLDADPAALAEVRAALRDPDAVHRWFDGEHPDGDGWFLGTVVAALLRRTTTAAEVRAETAALTAARSHPARTDALAALARRSAPDSADAR